MPAPKGKQATRGNKLIAEENVQTLKMYLYIISGVNAVFYTVYYLLFWDQFTSLPVFMCVLISAIYFGSYQFMKVIGRSKYHEGQLVDPGVDLNMTNGGMAEHTKDIILLAAIVQLSSLTSNYFWLLLLAAPARGFYMLWVNFLGPWFFSPAEEEVVNEKKQKKMERKMKRQQVMMR